MSVSRLVKGPTSRDSGEALESGRMVSGSVWSMWTWVKSTAEALVTSVGTSGGGKVRGRLPPSPSESVR
jgi:hypothetical protein